MLYNALAGLWHGGYEPKPRFCIFLIKNSAMQRQRHHTTGPLYAIKKTEIDDFHKLPSPLSLPACVRQATVRGSLKGTLAKELNSCQQALYGYSYK